MFAKSILAIALFSAAVPGIDLARKSTHGLLNMQATVAMLGDTDVLRDNARYAACMREIAGHAEHLSGERMTLPASLPNSEGVACR